MRDTYGEVFAGADLFLNSATYGLPSRRQTERLRGILSEWESGTMNPAQLDDEVDVIRVAFAHLAGVDPETVTMGASTSSLLSLLAAGLPDGTSVATMAGEFTSVSAPFWVHHQRGVTVTALAPGELEARAAEFDVVAVSLVQSADGTVLDVDTLRASLAAQRNDNTVSTHTRVILDVTQAMGWKYLELDWADAVVGSTYKWLLCPRGLAWMSIAADWADDLTALAANWYSCDDPWSNTYALPPAQSATARRFDLSPAWFTVAGAAVAMPWLASLDLRSIERHCVGLCNLVRAELGLNPGNSAILSLEHPHAATALDAAGIKAANRAGGTRVSFHLYNTEADAQALLTALGS